MLIIMILCLLALPLEAVSRTYTKIVLIVQFILQSSNIIDHLWSSCLAAVRSLYCTEHNYVNSRSKLEYSFGLPPNQKPGFGQVHPGLQSLVDK